MYAAGADIGANEAEWREWLPTIAQVSPEVAAEIALPEFLTETDVERIQEVTDILVEQGLLEDGYDPADDTFVAEG